MEGFWRQRFQFFSQFSLAACKIIYAITQHRKYIAPSLTFSSSYFPATPPTPSALEIKSANSVSATDIRRENQEAPLGTALAANRRCREDRNFFRFDQ